MSVFDELKITILGDGTIKTVSDAVSPDNHDSAESFLRTVSDLAGGKVTREAREDAPHGHFHTHEEGKHHHH